MCKSNLPPTTVIYVPSPPPSQVVYLCGRWCCAACKLLIYLKKLFTAYFYTTLILAGLVFLFYLSKKLKQKGTYLKTD